MAKQMNPLDVPLEERKKVAARMLQRNPDRVPVVVLVRNDNTSLPITLKERRFMVPRDARVNYFMATLRRRCELSDVQSYFLFATREPNVGGQELLLTGQQTFEQIYRDHVAEDGILYFVLSTENAFGLRCRCL